MLRRTVLAVIVAGCGGGELVVTDGSGELGQTPTWEQFLASVYRDPEGVFVVDGDTPIDDVKHLREFYERHVGPSRLIVHRVNGADSKWNDTQKLNISYCVSTTFGTRYQTVVQAMADATGAWEAAANVDFVHVSAQDSSCTASNTNVVFDVRPVNAGGAYLARAFFPHQSRSSRNVLIDGSAFNMSPPGSLTGILRHELGHALGFRHEHTRPEAGSCFEDTSWRALTPYDSASVMHYPQCNGTNTWALELTAMDKQGAAALYGAPGSPPPPPPPGGTTTETFSGSVAQGENDHFGPFSVVSGTLFEVVMTGTGDPDLYVRFDGPPTTTAYDCRPYRSGASETCSLTVPSNRSTAYVMVRGYTSGTYSIEVRYTKSSTPPPSGTPKTATFSGSVAQGQNAHYGPLAVKPGTTFKVVMTGSGDPDLYVRFGSQPTTTAYDCRPYLDGPDETCTLTVPSGASEAYLMVRGYLAGTYRLDVTYTAP